MWVHFTTGRGPGECQIACQKLTGIFIREAENAGFEANLLESVDGNHGLLSSLVAVEGDAEQFVAQWEGTIRWTCPSPLRPGYGRKNWFVSVNVIRPPAAAETLRESDIQFQTYRASGPGGQHVQKTESAVRVTHVPTGLVAQAQEERSQHRNKTLALARLSTLLAERAEQESKKADHTKWRQHDALQRGNPVKIFKGPDFRQ